MMLKSNLAVLVAVLVTIVTSTLVHAAPPPLPSSFYGTVTLNGANVPAGTLVSAWMDAVKVAEAATTVVDGDSVFTIDVPGAPSDTASLPGELEGRTIVFQVAGIAADQTGVWHFGTYTRLDLTATAAIPDLQITKDDNGAVAMPGSAIGSHLAACW